MESMTRILWAAAGRPPGMGNVVGVCRVCGQHGTGLPFRDWVRATFTDWDKLQAGDIICQPCQFAFCEASELLAQRVGKDKPQRMRNYSHFVVGDEWIPLSKGNKAQMRDILLSGDWRVAVVAESGQKHIIFRAVPGQVQFEEQRLASLHGLEPLLADVEALYNAGFSKGEIESGHYAQYRIVKFGYSEWADLENRMISQWRGSLLFSLAIFLAQRKGEDENGNTGTSERTTQEMRLAAGGDMAERSIRVQEPLPPRNMAAIPGGSGERGANHEQPECVRQLALL